MTAPGKGWSLRTAVCGTPVSCAQLEGVKAVGLSWLFLKDFDAGVSHSMNRRKHIDVTGATCNLNTI